MEETDAGPTAAGLATVPRPSLHRSRSDRVVGGVAAGIGGHLGIDPLVVRIAFVVLAFAAGFGVVMYLLLWLLAPIEATGAPSAARLVARPTRQQLLGTGLVLVGVLTLLWIAGLWLGWGLGWPVSLAAIGFAVLWARSGGEEGHGRWDLRSFGSPLEAMMGSRVSAPRIVLGSVLSSAGWRYSSPPRPRSRRRPTSFSR